MSASWTEEVADNLFFTAAGGSVTNPSSRPPMYLRIKGAALAAAVVEEVADRLEAQAVEEGLGGGGEAGDGERGVAGDVGGEAVALLLVGLRLGVRDRRGGTSAGAFPSAEAAGRMLEGTVCEASRRDIHPAREEGHVS